jgi:hypothetical protein
VAEARLSVEELFSRWIRRPFQNLVLAEMSFWFQAQTAKQHPQKTWLRFFGTSLEKV